MRKKEMICLVSVVFLLMFLSVVTATNHTVESDDLQSDDKIDLAYSCLEDKISNRTISLQEAIFSTLALGSRSNLKDKIENEKKTNDPCWPKAGCTLKETAQVALALDRSGGNEGEVVEWLKSKNATLTELNWYLQIDITDQKSTECTIRYDNTEKKVNVLDNMQLQTDSGGCLSVSGNGYWLRISDSCYTKKFDISCKEDFITNLLYSKQNGETIYVSSKTNSAASLGTTSEQITAKCFKTGGNCDYEGSLWAALALQQLDEEVSPYVPYLLALAEDNKKYFPDTFLYILVGGDDKYSDIVQSQKQSKYREIVGSPYNRFYDTSLAMLSLQGSSAPELDNAQNYLLEIQGRDGCWNNGNIRDTAFILYSGWKKGASTGGGEIPIPGGEACEVIGTTRSCSKASDCTTAGGQILNNYECDSFGDFCCSIKVEEQTCAEKNGNICASNEECTGQEVSAGDGTCCLSTCQQKEDVSTCEINDGICRASCADDEEQINEICSGGGVCCIVVNNEGGKKVSWGLIIILALLVLLIILAIHYRDKLRVWWYKFKGRASSSPIKRPGVPPSGSGGVMRPVMRPLSFGVPPNRPIRDLPPTRTAPRVSSKDKEMEETLKKLRDMTK